MCVAIIVMNKSQIHLRTSSFAWIYLSPAQTNSSYFDKDWVGGTLSMNSWDYLVSHVPSVRKGISISKHGWDGWPSPTSSPGWGWILASSSPQTHSLVTRQH